VDEPGVRSGELFAALSLATDLGTGQPPEHALRTCLLAVSLSELAGLDDAERADAYYLALLHSIGCTADAHEAALLFGDDLAPRADYALIDPARPPEMIAFLWRRVAQGAPPIRRARAFATAVAVGRAHARQSFTSHCEVGLRLAERLGLEPGVRRGLDFVFERWDGRGLPSGVKEDAIPIAARVLHTARAADVFHATGGVEAVEAMAARNAGGELDPQLAGLLRSHAAELLGALDAEAAWEAVLAAEPVGGALRGERLDEACRAMADFSDLKSPHTLRHSTGVSELAEAAAWRLGLDGEAASTVRRAGWLHDLGRVGVSTAIWDKPALLSGADWEAVRLHPYYTERALARAAGLAELGTLGALHHERLDGSGYHKGLATNALPVLARVLAAADAFQAMTEPRAFRAARTAGEAAAELARDAAAGRLDADVVKAVLAAAGQRDQRVARTRPAGLTDREVDVLRLLARGMTNKSMASELELSPKTVGHHVESIYSKVGVSTRAAAALFAVEHDLLA